jgi:hypothetical protein
VLHRTAPLVPHPLEFWPQCAQQMSPTDKCFSRARLPACSIMMGLSEHHWMVPAYKMAPRARHAPVRGTNAALS